MLRLIACLPTWGIKGKRQKPHQVKQENNGKNECTPTSRSPTNKALWLYSVNKMYDSDSKKLEHWKGMNKKKRLQTFLSKSLCSSTFVYTIAVHKVPPTPFLAHWQLEPFQDYTYAFTELLHFKRVVYPQGRKVFPPGIFLFIHQCQASVAKSLEPVVKISAVKKIIKPNCTEFMRSCTNSYPL